jgi:hypothetical protein
MPHPSGVLKRLVMRKVCIHQGLARQTPNEVYFATELRKAA